MREHHAVVDPDEDLRVVPQARLPREDQVEDRAQALQRVAAVGRPVALLHVDVEVVVAAPRRALVVLVPRPLQRARRAVRLARIGGRAAELVHAELPEILQRRVRKVEPRDSRPVDGPRLRGAREERVGAGLGGGARRGAGGVERAQRGRDGERVAAAPGGGEERARRADEREADRGVVREGLREAVGLDRGRREAAPLELFARDRVLPGGDGAHGGLETGGQRDGDGARGAVEDDPERRVRESPRAAARADLDERGARVEARRVEREALGERQLQAADGQQLGRLRRRREDGLERGLVLRLERAADGAVGLPLAPFRAAVVVPERRGSERELEDRALAPDHESCRGVAEHRARVRAGQGEVPDGEVGLGEPHGRGLGRSVHGARV